MAAFNGVTLQPPPLLVGGQALPTATQTAAAWTPVNYVAAALPRTPKVKIWNGSAWVLAPTELP